MKLTALTATYLKILSFLLILMSVTGCKKDKLEVNEVKEYSQVDHKPGNAFDGGWALTLQTDGVAEVNPGGDIRYRGTYKINGDKIKVKTEQNSKSYTFKIISETQIKETESSTLLNLR